MHIFFMRLGTATIVNATFIVTCENIHIVPKNNLVALQLLLFFANHSLHERHETCPSVTFYFMKKLIF